MRTFWRLMVIGVACLVLAVTGVWAGAMYHTQIAAAMTEAMGHNHAAATATAPAKQLYTCSMHTQVIEDHPGDCPICHMKLTPIPAGVTTKPHERKVVYWTDPMYNPPYISDKPGKSPMGMDLLPVYEDEVAGGSGVTIDPVVVQNMGVRLAKVVRGPLLQSFRVTGMLQEPEQNHYEVNLRVSGWIEKLHVNQEGMAVAKGDPLFDLYSPELTLAADELIAQTRETKRNANSSDAMLRNASVAMLDGVRRKLQLWGLTTEQVDEIAKLDKAPHTFTFRSPMTGHITEKMVVEGSAVKAGDKLMRVADRSSMWLLLQVFESQLPLVNIGTPVKATVTGLADKPIEGTVSFIYPHLDTVTRTAMVRVVLPNHDHNLHENMYATAQISVPTAEERLLVPREALLDSGIRQVVFVAEGNGRFSPRQVTVGQAGYLSGSHANDEMVQILTGVTENENVVVSGQFLLDAASRMQEAIEKRLAPA